MIQIHVGDKFKAQEGNEKIPFGDCILTVIEVYDDLDKGTINERYKIHASNGETDNVRNPWLTGYFEKIDAT